MAAKWAGRCPACQAWGSVTESAPASAALRRVAAPIGAAAPQRLRDVDATTVTARPSGVAELDRVLGGGLVPGGVVLLAGEPGVGKSTLLLAAAQEWAAAGNGPVLIVTGEETAGQVGLRARRLGAVHRDIFLAAETDLSAVLAQIEAVGPTLVVVDSIQTVFDPQTDGGVGGVSQVKAVAAALTAVAKHRQIACVLVGHVTKDGSVAGPRVLEHLVDVVLHFEGDRHTPLRMVRGVKNRFGPADEVGCFAMTDTGIASLADPSGLFLSTRTPAGAGHLRNRDRAGTPGAPRRDTDPGGLVRVRRGPANGFRPGLLTGVDGARRAATLGRVEDRRPGRSRRDRRRGQDHRAGLRSGHRNGGVVVGPGHPAVLGAGGHR